MVHCGSQYGVYIHGTWTWFNSYAEAVRAEAEILMTQIAQKRKRGEQVILTADIGDNRRTSVTEQRARRHAEVFPRRDQRAKQVSRKANSLVSHEG